MTGDDVRGLTLIALAIILSTGCASAGHRTDQMSRTEKLAYLAIGADVALTAYGLATTDLRESGIAHRWTGDDATAIASVVLVNAVLVYALRRAHRKRPNWRGWRSVDLGISIASSVAAANSAKLILDY